MKNLIKAYKILLISFGLFFTGAIILITNSDSIKAQGYGTCTNPGECIGNGQFCQQGSIPGTGYIIDEINCGCNAIGECWGYQQRCLAGSIPGWGIVWAGDPACVCAPDECAGCNVRCNADGTDTFNDLSCSNLCSINYINNQIYQPQQNANYWIQGDGKYGPNDNNYIYLDPEAINPDQNSIFINSNSLNGNFINLQVSNQEKFKVDKTGDVFMNNLYVNNIIGDDFTSEVNSYLYRTFDVSFHPYFSTPYQFYFPSQNKPSGSGKYLIIGANTDSGTARIYIVKEDTGEIVSKATGIGKDVAGLAVVQQSLYGANYVLYAAIDGDSDGDRELHRFPILFLEANNYEPQITSSAGQAPGFNGQPFFIQPVANLLYITSNEDYKLVKYNPAMTGSTIYVNLGYQMKPYTLALQTSPEPALVVSIWSGSGSSWTGYLRKFSLLDLTPLSPLTNLGSDCNLPKLMAFDKYSHLWVTCSNTQYYYWQTPFYEYDDNVLRYNFTTGVKNVYNVPMYSGGNYIYHTNSLPFGIYYHPTLEQILVGNRADGRIYRYSLEGKLLSCDGSVVSDLAGLSDLEACTVSDGDPLGQLISSHPWYNSDSFWILNMSGNNPQLYRSQPMETLYTGDLYASGHVASFGFFLDDEGVTSYGHERMLIDISGYNDKINFVGYQTGVGQAGDRAAMAFFGDNATNNTNPEYDMGQFLIQSEQVIIGSWYDGTAVANSVGTKNKGQIYLQGMSVFGTDSNFSKAAVLTASENLLYGVADSSSSGNLLKLDVKNGASYQTRFSVDNRGNTTVGGRLKTPGGLEIIGGDTYATCPGAPTNFTDGTMYVCAWCAGNVRHRELKVYLLNSWFIIRDQTGSGTCGL